MSLSEAMLETPSADPQPTFPPMPTPAGWMPPRSPQLKLSTWLLPDPRRADMTAAFRYRRPFRDSMPNGMSLALGMGYSKRPGLGICFDVRPALSICHALGMRLPFRMRLAVGVSLAITVSASLAGAVSLGSGLRHQPGEQCRQADAK